MSKTLQAAWDAFAENANFDDLHEYDLARFAAFTATAHHPGRRKDRIDFEALLQARLPGWEQDEVHGLSVRLSELYDFGRLLLKQRR